MEQLANAFKKLWPDGIASGRFPTLIFCTCDYQNLYVLELIGVYLPLKPRPGESARSRVNECSRVECQTRASV